VNEPLFSLKNRWFTASVGALVLIAVVAAAVGFIWVPRAVGEGAMATMWESICSAAGAPAPFSNPARPDDHAVYPTAVIVDAAMMGPPDRVSVGRGATLALQCSMCHGARGTASVGTDVPSLAGQPASATYKQLRDFKSGHRHSVTMQPLASNLGDQDMRDLAAFYAIQQRDTLVDHALIRQAAPILVSNGAPMRNIGACAACHGPREARVATPNLDGLPEQYLRKQLAGFRSGHRANDINRQMRNAAHGLTDSEIAAIARYYARR
jgi:cytochrome c553